MKYIAFDLETTGVKPESDRILEFSFIELDGELVEMGRWTKLVDPGVAIPAEIQELTGITPEMVVGQPAFATHAARIQALVEGATLIAHNYEFDLRFLSIELVRAGQPGLKPDHPCIDTVIIERQFTNNRLGTVYKRYTGKEMDGAHRSEADTAATVEVLRHQRKVHAAALPQRLEDLLVPLIERKFEGEARARQWLDHDHRFYRDPSGTVRFGFGKYRDEPALAHEDYLVWMRGKDFSNETKAAIDMILKGKPATVTAVARPSGPTASPATTAAASQARLLQ